MQGITGLRRPPLHHERSSVWIRPYPQHNLRPPMNKKNTDGARRRKLSTTAVLLLSAALAACQSFAPVATEPPLAPQPAAPVDIAALTPVELPSVDYRERVA